MLAAFRDVQPNRPGRSLFDLSHRKVLTCDMGQLIPVFCQEAIPGDSWKLGNELVTRLQPLVAPVMHEINAYIHYFFVPYRLLWEDWEEFITGGADGEFSEAIPVWAPSTTAKCDESTLWDYLGFPTGITPPVGFQPIDFPRRAYNLIWNEYYRDETLQTPLDITVNEDIKLRNWEKDYFTSALPWQQRGTAPALPISGTSNAVWPDSSFLTGTNSVNLQLHGSTSGQPYAYVANATAKANAKAFFDGNVVDLSSAVTFDVADLRLATQIQRWMERNARGGVRYTEFLQMHYGVQPQDSRLQRPEYIGGMKSPVLISEVLQTSGTGATGTTTPLANLGGKGITVGADFCGRYYAQEFGVILGLLSVMPRTQYQQGINRQWLRRTNLDFYNPAFAHLSEQPINKGEIYTTTVLSENETIFGYQGRYDELRYIPSTVHGQMRSTYDYWHMGRKFTSAPALNSSFVECNPTKRIFAAPSQPALIMHIGNRCQATRPMPMVSDPGFMDH